MEKHLKVFLRDILTNFRYETRLSVFWIIVFFIYMISKEWDS